MTVTENPCTTVEHTSNELDAISQRLVSARVSAEALPGFPGQLPDTMAEAYAIQKASIARWSDDIVGWKVGGVPEEMRAQLGAERLAGPIFRSSVFSIESGSSRTMPIYSGGFAAVEAEFVLQIGTTIEPEERDYSDSELEQLVSALHVGAEIASSPMAAINQLGPRCVVSDFGNNAGLLVGPAIPNWTSLSPEALTAKVTLNNKVAGIATARAIEGGLLQPLRFLIGLSATRGIALEAGTLVSTGALTGIHDVTTESKAIVDFGAFGAFDVAFESMMPRQ